MAIDEKRRMFRLDDWEVEQEYKPNVFSTGKKKIKIASKCGLQDVIQTLAGGGG